MDLPGVTFETKCWEKDWEYLLKTDRLQQAVEYNCFNFRERVLYINNVSKNSLSEVLRRADSCIAKAILTSYVVVEDYAEEALDFFSITKESLGCGYYYSIAELVGIFLCNTEYLLHFSSDSMLANPFTWVDKALAKMGQDEHIKVANPTWNGRYHEAKLESFCEDADWYTGLGFSDQCYLVAPREFRKKIYTETHPASSRYPQYGGELFEKRVDSWMRNHQHYRITYKHGTYIHQNFTTPCFSVHQ